MSCIFDTFSNPINQGKKGETLNKHGNKFNNSKILQEPPLRHARGSQISNPRSIKQVASSIVA